MSSSSSSDSAAQSRRSCVKSISWELQLLALPQLVELLRGHQLDLRELGLVGDRRDVALAR